MPFLLHEVMSFYHPLAGRFLPYKKAAAVPSGEVFQIASPQRDPASFTGNQFSSSVIAELHFYNTVATCDLYAVVFLYTRDACVLSRRNVDVGIRTSFPDKKSFILGIAAILIKCVQTAVADERVSASGKRTGCGKCYTSIGA